MLDPCEARLTKLQRCARGAILTFVVYKKCDGKGAALGSSKVRRQGLSSFGAAMMLAKGELDY